ncbi:MAG: hypothetical protein A2158_01455 [Chloroflexi bacterium RBG_13_46_14]|nr:MAG: hypothetical protein A2158_01455 [Chloroflexi bacterium RBG_13_46_14]
MAEIQPFRGVHYNESHIKYWSEVICPPYDIISPQEQYELYLKSEYNYIRIESGRELPQDTPTDNKYTRSAALFHRWLEEGVLRTDDTPSLYLHDHYFSRRRKQYKRRSFISRVRLEEWDKMAIRPHEGTLTEARGDRLSLLFAMQANTSPILVMYQDNGMRITSMLADQARQEPLISARMDNDERHDMWMISDIPVIEKIQNIIANRPLYIADGHHRYESALAYRKEQQVYSGSDSGNEAFNFVMMSLVEFSDPGLMILAPHRLVRGIPKSNIEGLYSKLKTFFSIEEIDLKHPEVWVRVEDILTHTSVPRIVLFGINQESLFILALNNREEVSKMMPYFHSDIYKNLDVSIVDHIILENLLALNSEKEKESLAFSYDMRDAVEKVRTQEYQLALLLNPVRPEMIKTISDAGDKMPRKSTYFYPKSPAGLVINRLDRD